MRLGRLFIVFISLWTTLIAQEDVVIYLPTSDQFNPIYIAPFKPIDSNYSSQYIQTLCEAFIRDFELDGKSHVLPQNEEINKRFYSSDLKNALQKATIEQLSINHLIYVQIEKQDLKLSLYDPQTSTVIHFNALHLNGNMDKDVEQIHCLADSVHKKIYGIDGIARTKILYAYHPPSQQDNIENWTSEIYLMDYNGGNAKQITKENSYCICPQFFPDRNQFMYVCYKNGQPKIYSSVIGQSQGQPIVQLRGNQLLPTISKKSDLIAYISDASGRPDLFVQQFDPDKGTQSKPIQLYSYPQSVQASPTFSPDGSKIAFVSDKDRSPKIYLLDLRNSLSATKLPQIRCLTTKNRESTCPCWSPDGTKIAYSTKVNGVRQIWIYDIEQKIEYQLTKGPGNKENPSWAPNSLHLVYNTSSPQSDVYMINLNHQVPIKLTSGEGIKHYPCWESISN